MSLTESEVNTMNELIRIFERAIEVISTSIFERLEALEANFIDTGWKDIPLVNGAIPYSDTNKPQYRKIGNQVFLRGVFKGITNQSFTFGNMPANCRPKNIAAYFIGGSVTIEGKATFFNLQINPGGSMVVNSGSLGSYSSDYYCRLSGSYLVD